ncbi:MAG: aminopeptidase P family protein [Planctomycetes bacterium]|nr:aminopeptidase P family protein [Planctomycetota bacterium]
MPSADSPLNRRRRLVRRLAGRRADAMLVTSAPNVRYLSGFGGEDSWLLVGRGWAVLLTDSRFAEQATLDCPGVEHVIRDGAMADALAGALRGRKVRRLAFESEHVTVAEHAKLAEAIGERRLTGVEAAAAGLRAVKDDGEVAAIRRAIRMAERAFAGLIAGGAKALLGRREDAVAGELEYRMRQAGAAEASFPTIVAAGAHGSLPHHRPGPARIRDGQAVLFDWGAKAGGYCSDLTRVVFVGRIPPQMGRIYEVVLKAQKASIEAIRPGRPASSVDGVARRLIAQAGFAGRFGHGLGHGVGLEIHESPALSPRNQARLRAGQVVTVEPGIYVPGVGGVRIEDDVLVTPDGAQVLSRLPKAIGSMVLH